MELLDQSYFLMIWSNTLKMKKLKQQLKKYLHLIIQKIQLIKPNLYGKKKLIAGFEYGLLIANVAKEQGVELTPETVLVAEKMITTEFKQNNCQELANQMIP